MKDNVEDIYPLSPMQEGMLFHSLYDSASRTYFEQLHCTLRGKLNLAAFERAWQNVAERHPILRTAFVWEGLEEPLQVAQRQVELPLARFDWRGLSQDQQESQLGVFLQADKAQGFELSQAPLMRLALMQTGADTHYFVWSHHHLLIDGWSLPLLLREVFAFYEAHQQGRAIQPEPARPYRDYIAWLQAQDPAQAESFWRRTLKGFAAPTPLVVDRRLKGETEYAVERMRLSAEITSTLQSLARARQVTLSTILQGAWAILLHRYSGEEDVVFGATVSGRPAGLPGAETMIGLFINTLPIRAQLSPEATTLSLLKTLQAQQAELRQYEYSSLTQIREWSDVPRGLPLFESILVFENYPMDASNQESKGSLEICDLSASSRTNYPLTFVISPGAEMGLEIAYDGRRFDSDTTRRMLCHLQTLLEGMAANPDGQLGSLPLLTDAEQRQLLIEWNDTAAEFPAGCIHHLFESQVERTPDHIALAFEEQRLTYAELNQRANQLAHHLQTLGVKPETLVGICLERSPEMIVSVLAVLKAGGAYLPLDPTYPPERLAFMLADSQAPVLLTRSSLLAQLPPHPATTVCLDSDWPIIAEHPITNYQLPITPDNLAYVIYTSGSTGQPKGALLQHRGLCNFVNAFARDMRVGTDSRVLQFASFSFDAAVAEIFIALLNGAALHFARSDTLLSLPDLTQLLRDQRITTASLPPSLLTLLPPEGLPALQTVAAVGEPCPPDVARRWSAGRRFLNGYGPTENTIGATWAVIENLPPEATTVPIGRPIDNVQLYLLDSCLRPVPVGVPGELHIGGVGLARGYLNRPQLTAEKFIEIRELENSPILQSPRLYKTGDLCRYLPDGNLEFLGRIDQQVKVRGFRIELGEIEAALAQHPALQAAAVIARDDERGEKYLAAYIVPKSEPAPGVDELRRHLQATLPAYMIPSAFVTLSDLPRLPNGKVNRKALPAPDHAGLEATYLAPRTPTEEILAGLWARVLNLERIGIHDNFFELGGHSLKATQLVSRVREAFNVELPIRALFESPTVAGLAAHLEAAATAHLPPITPVSRDGALPLSFAQQRLWFLDQLAPGNLFYNIPAVIRLTGALDAPALERALNEIIRRHEALRTRFVEVGGKPAQLIAPELALPLPLADLSGAPDRDTKMLQAAADEIRQPFDLARGPLLRARLLRLADDDHLAILTLHHIIADGWSMGVLIREVAALYETFTQGKPSLLPNLPLQYADFAAWQHEWLKGETLETQLAYWKEKLGGAPPLLELPTDRPRPAVQTSNGDSLSFTLSRELSNALTMLSREEGATPFMTLLATFQILLHRYSGQEDICVGTPIANRNHAEVENLIGFFVNTLVLRARFDGGPTFRDLLKQVRETALGAYAHQDLPFEMLVEALQPQRDLSHTPLFQAMFVLDNTPRDALRLPGLTLTPVSVDTGQATFDLTLSLSEGSDGFAGSFEYNADLFDAATIERLAGHFKTLLAAVTANPDQPLTALPLLTDAERHTMLVAWNNTAAPFPNDLCFHQLFEAHAQRQPDATALTFENQALTYRQLNERANQLAHHLLSLGLQPDTLVAIAADRSFDMIIAVLAALKAGGAFLPLDPAYPPDRLAFMLHDSQAPVLLTQAHLLERLPQHAATALCLDADWPAIANSLISNPHAPLSPENLAYCIYTSGSTGQPKGTLLRHRGLSNLATVQRQAFQLGPASRVLQFSPFSFDASVWEIAMSLGNGATLSLAPQEVLASGPDLLKLLRDQAITTVTLPPSMLNVLTPEALPDLHTIISAGEACSRELVQRWATGRQFFDAYGPTETTVCASMALCDPDDEREPSIGKPIANFQLFILDPHQHPVPVGVPGELHIGGVGLARGYLNRPELTAEKFIETGELESSPILQALRLYKTGDLCRFRPDGNIEFLGRIDGQVKVRGFRIELGEVESVLKGHPAVLDGAVLARDNRLVAYVVAQAEAAAPASDLRAFLRQRLPEYMVPSAFVVLPVLPLSPSGKVDRKALAALDVGRAEERPYVAPRTETEATLARLCAELLELERVGVDDNFFELGGHSLLATQFVSRVRQAFGIELPLRALFEHPSIAELAVAIEAMQGSAATQAPTIVPVSRAAHRVKRAVTVKGGNGSSGAGEEVRMP